jgi:hypothetical protein
MEDGWILARAIEHSRPLSASTGAAIGKALLTFDSIRSPYYLRM